jgi:hypothetical protein
MYQRRRNGVPYGGFRQRIGGKMVTLGDDLETARARARELLAAKDAPPAEPAPPAPTEAQPTAPPATSPAAAPPSPAAPLPSAARAALARLSTPAPANGGSLPASTPAAPPVDPVKREKAERLAALAAKILTNANTAAIGMGVRVFGHRTPALPDPDEREVLAEAWTEYLTDVLGDKNMHPLVVVGLANAGIAFGMYRQGTPLPADDLTERRQLAPRPAAANAAGETARVLPFVPPPPGGGGRGEAPPAAPAEPQ